MEIMTKGLTFSSAFWDSDIIGTYGWDILCKRMKDGKKVCTEIAHYLKDRAKTEQEYSKSLLSLGKRDVSKDEIGVLGDSLQALKAQTEKIAYAHDEAAQLFSKMSEELTQFHEEQKKNKHMVEENVKKYIQSKKNDYQKAMNLKKSYEQKCVDYNNAEETHKTMERSATCKPSDKQKAQNKMDKAFEARNNADTAYKSAVECLESSRKNWEQETEAAYEQLEALEKMRIDFLRNHIWKTANVDSDVCVKHDACSEKVREVLEHCDISEEIQFFVEHHKSGSKRPDPIKYEDYYGGSNNDGSTPKTRRPPQMRAPVIPPQAKRQTSEDGFYSTVDGPSYAPSKVLLAVVWEHRARKAAELDVNIGDRLELLDSKPIDGMLKVKLAAQNSARVGFVPDKCVTKDIDVIHSF